MKLFQQRPGNDTTYNSLTSLQRTRLKFLRMILGDKYVNDERSFRYNDKLHQMFGPKNIVERNHTKFLRRVAH